MAVDIEPWLAKYGIDYNEGRRGNQPISCPNKDAHKHGDRTPSASLHLDKGLFSCLACGAGGSAVDLIMLMERTTLREALQLAEASDAGSGGEVSRQPERSSLGLPGRPRVHGRDGGKPPAWAGFR